MAIVLATGNWQLATMHPWKPGYRTTEHWLAWGVLLLGAIALLRGAGALERASGTLASAIASAGYSIARAQVKGSRAKASRHRRSVPAPPPCPPLADQLTDLFRGRPGR